MALIERLWSPRRCIRRWHGIVSSTSKLSVWNFSIKSDDVNCHAFSVIFTYVDSMSTVLNPSPGSVESAARYCDHVCFRMSLSEHGNEELQRQLQPQNVKKMSLWNITTVGNICRVLLAMKRDAREFTMEVAIHLHVSLILYVIIYRPRFKGWTVADYFRFMWNLTRVISSVTA